MSLTDVVVAPAASIAAVLVVVAVAAPVVVAIAVAAIAIAIPNCFHRHCSLHIVSAFHFGEICYSGVRAVIDYVCCCCC